MIRFFLFFSFLLLNFQTPLKSANLDASLYNDHSDLQHNLASKIIEDIQLKGNELCLDIGCGNGLNTYLLSQKLTSGLIIGIDNSPTMISFSEKKYSSPKCSYQIQDFDEFQEENKYDLITVFSSLYCFKSPKEAYKKILKALKFGGKAYILTYPKEDPIWKTCYDSLVESVKWRNYGKESAYLKILSIEDHLTFLKTLPAELEEFTDGKWFSKHPDIEEFQSYLASWAPLFINLPSYDLISYVDKVTQRSLPLFIFNEQGIEVPCRYLKVVLKK